MNASREIPTKIAAAARTLQKLERLTPFVWGWRNKVKRQPGVYAVWKRGSRKTPVYIGETANLQERMKDLGNWRNHTFARKIRSRRRFKNGASLRAHISDKYVVCCMPVGLGRKEIEEVLVLHWNTDKAKSGGFNNPCPRRWRCDA